MNKQEFRESFYKEYPYSCITVQDLKNIIEEWPENEMPFRIIDSWSWRGIYANVCLCISNEITSKSDNLSELKDVTHYCYTGWKGGEYYYNMNTLVHFEEDAGDCTTYDEDSCYFVNFLKDNNDNPFIQSIYKYFENNRHLNQEYHQDYLGKDLEINNKVIYYSMDGFKTGFIKEINKEAKMVTVIETLDDNAKSYIKPYNQVVQIYDL